MTTKKYVRSLQEYGRGIIGGLLFSLPMLYTMEVWWTSFDVKPYQLLLYLLVTYVLLLAYNTYAGLRATASWKEIAIDSVEEMGLGLVLSFVFLWLLGQFNPEAMSFERLVYLTVVEAMPIAIGVSVGTAQLGASAQDEEEDQEDAPEAEPNAPSPDRESLLEQIMLATCAGMLFGANIAPTDEVLEIGLSATPFQLLLLVLVSLVLSASVLFYIEFKGTAKSKSQPRPGFIDVASGLSVTYAVAFLVSAGVLWFFGRFEGGSWETGIKVTIVLTVVTSLGASAGRFLLDQEFMDNEDEEHEKEPS
ncbi:TIGR02587 family membrane protein [Rufibacter sp. LB8]|uniref:TIGR02587 family membrane protein n=1 Tax=Rufibacter sp. LB8 TaxID=2777781 RepID=UPI00178C5AD3|nr:TIGR02587 family membrane protein [Rufibacter sp. LB8]